MQSDLALLMAAVNQNLELAQGFQNKASFGSSTYLHSQKKKEKKIIKKKILHRHLGTIGSPLKFLYISRV